MARKRAKKEVREQKEKSFHSLSYHRYFEGYAENEVVQPNGKRRIKRVYVGDYYRQELRARQRILRKTLYTGLYIMACASFITAGTWDIEMNRAWYVAAPVAVSVFFLFWLLLPMFFYVTAPEKMVVRTYRDSSKNLIRLSFTTAIVLAVTAAMALFSAFILPAELNLTAFAAPCLFLVASILLFCLWRLEKNMPYTIISSTERRPDESVVI